MTATSTPQVDLDDPFALARRIRDLGCAVALFTPDELGLHDTREIEDAMAEAGTERIAFLNDALSPAERYEASGQTGPCNDFAPDTAGPDPLLCTTCLQHHPAAPVAGAPSAHAPQCGRCDGPWGQDVTCEGCTDETGNARPTPTVTARAYSDDRVVEVEFDATGWFATATDDEIAALADCGFGGDYPSDGVAERTAEQSDPQGLDALFDYLDRVRGTSRATGFECRVDEREAARWLLVHRRPLLVRLGLNG